MIIEIIILKHVDYAFGVNQDAIIRSILLTTHCLDLTLQVASPRLELQYLTITF